MIDDVDGKGAEELEERLREKEAKTQAILLEMVRRSKHLNSAFSYQRCRRSHTLLSYCILQVGDLPDADMRPPENVLFVCKLNPVTTDEDLEIIFSRFGAIKR